MEDKFIKLVEEADRILVTSHISPDPDAVSSTLLTGRGLIENYHNKQVLLNLEEEPLDDLSFLEGYNLIKFSPLNQVVSNFKPQLIIIVDANNFDRVSRKNGDDIRAYISAGNGSVKTAVIDHHELDGIDNPDVLINNKRPASAEEVYVLLFERLGLKRPQNYAQTTLLGIISDTQRHKFDHPGYRETYRIVADLLDTGVSIEKLESRLERHTDGELEAISHLASNMASSGRGYSYTFVSDEFWAGWRNENKSLHDLKTAIEFFTSSFIRNFEGNSWGFVIYPDLALEAGCWHVSLRSVSDAKDVSAIARKLGGGGHKPAAGAKIKAKSVNEVLKTIEDVIAENV